MKIAFGMLVAIGLGVFCRFFDIPLPGPPAIMGAVMAIAMASGYTATDYLLTRRNIKPPMVAAKETDPNSAIDQPRSEFELAIGPKDHAN